MLWIENTNALSKNISGFYSKTIKTHQHYIFSAIRAEDPDTIIFYEPVTWALFAPFDYNPLFDPILAFSFESLDIFDVKSVLGSFHLRHFKNCVKTYQISIRLVNKSLLEVSCFSRQNTGGTIFYFIKKYEFWL